MIAALANRVKVPRTVFAASTRFIFRKTLLHSLELFICRWRLPRSFPFVLRHSVDQLSRRSLVAFKAGIHDPVCQAIPAKTGQPHQVNILRIVAVLQMKHQSLESRRRYGIVQLVERTRIRIHL